MSASACLFCEIVAGTRPAHVVLDTADVLAFLDVRPVFPGHCLVVPRVHVETLTELPEASLGTLFAAVQRVARAVQGGMEAHGSFVAVNNRVSQSVPHLHVHVVPRRFKDGLRGFFWPRTKYEHDDHASETAAKVRAAVAELTGG